MRKFLVVSALGAAALGVTACACPHGGGGAHHGGGAAMTGCPMCAKGMAGESVWCDHCGAGFVGGQKVGCKGCYAAKTGGAPCPMCSKKM